MAKCQGCGADVVWLQSIESNKRAPVDPKPTFDGNVHVFRMAKGQAFQVVPPSKLGEFRAQGIHLHKLHFATCPQAERFKRCGRCHKTPCRCQGALF